MDDFSYLDHIFDNPHIDDEPLYVNAKQYFRILKRRVARSRLDELHRLSRQRKPYLHESRHKHAMRRPRGPGGRFLTAEEIAAQKRSDVAPEHEQDDPDDDDQMQESEDAHMHTPMLEQQQPQTDFFSAPMQHHPNPHSHAHIRHPHNPPKPVHHSLPPVAVSSPYPANPATLQMHHVPHPHAHARHHHSNMAYMYGPDPTHGPEMPRRPQEMLQFGAPN